jgi:hypothetical protein
VLEMAGRESLPLRHLMGELVFAMGKRILLLDDPAPLGRSHSATDGAGGVRCRATLSLRWAVFWNFYSWFVHGADRSRGEVPGFVWYQRLVRVNKPREELPRFNRGPEASSPRLSSGVGAEKLLLSVSEFQTSKTHRDNVEIWPALASLVLQRMAAVTPLCLKNSFVSH